MEHVELVNPIILLITDTNADLLSAEFGRYRRDYDIRLARSESEATMIAEQVANTDHPLALMVADTALWAATNPADPITAIAQFLRHWRHLERTAKALVVAPVDRYATDHDHLRASDSNVALDAFLLLPRGVADRPVRDISVMGSCSMSQPIGGDGSRTPRESPKSVIISVVSDP